jgi:hypothetical protein
MSCPYKKFAFEKGKFIRNDDTGFENMFNNESITSPSASRTKPSDLWRSKTKEELVVIHQLHLYIYNLFIDYWNKKIYPKVRVNPAALHNLYNKTYLLRFKKIKLMYIAQRLAIKHIGKINKAELCDAIIEHFTHIKDMKNKYHKDLKILFNILND